MNKILAEISVGELLDKISILEIKKEKIKDLSKSKFIAEEHAILKNQLNNNIKQDEHLEKLFANLKDIGLRDANLTNSILSGSDLTGAFIMDTILTNIHWYDTTCPDGANSDENENTCENNLN